MIKKRSLIVLAASMMVMTACSSGQDTKATEATSAKEVQTTAVTSDATDEAGKDATQEPATTVAETEEVTTAEETSAEDTIIPLFKSEYTVDDIKKISPEELYTFDNFCKYYPVEILEQKDDGFAICKVAYDDHFKLMFLDGTIYDIDYWIYGKPGGVLFGICSTTFELSPEADNMLYEYYNEYYKYHDENYEFYDEALGDPRGGGLIPLFYNSKSHCLVGYMYKDELEGKNGFSGNSVSTYNKTDYYLVEAFYDLFSYSLSYEPADAAKYGM